ncbi:MAG: hypothetical protein ACYTXA_33285 [Nostoc sp.]
MGFQYLDITGLGTDSNKFAVFTKGISIGNIIKQGNLWFVLKPGSNTCEAETFSDKLDAAKHLAELGGVDWLKSE